VEESRKRLAELEQTVEVSSGQLRWNGGIKCENLILWVDSLKTQPSVAECKLTAVTKLLTSQYFKGDLAIDDKRRNLGNRIRQYVKNRGGDSGAILGNAPVSIETSMDDKNWALGVVDGSLRWVTPPND
jgi:hypothetical protein